MSQCRVESDLAANQLSVDRSFEDDFNEIFSEPLIVEGREVKEGEYVVTCEGGDPFIADSCTKACERILDDCGGRPLTRRYANECYYVEWLDNIGTRLSFKMTKHGEK